MTECEKNGERLAMKISRHRQAKHEAIQYEDVKTAYIKGCEDTAREMVAHTIADIQNSKKEAAEIIGELLEFMDGLGNFSGGVFDRARQFIKGAE